MFEEVAPKRTGVFRDVVLIILCGFVLLSLPNWIPFLFGFPFVKAGYDFLVFFGVGLLIFRFLRSHGTEYQYVLADSVLTVRSTVGGRETVVAEIHLTGESSLIPLKDSADIFPLKGNDVRKISYGVSDKKTAYLLTFPMQNGKSALIFQPSDQFVEILQQLLLDKSEKM